MTLLCCLLFLFKGFQFNHVGGGTKTRRPITLHMKYNSSAVQPTCFLLTEDSGEQEVSLEELQVSCLSANPTSTCHSRVPLPSKSAQQQWQQCMDFAIPAVHGTLEGQEDVKT